MKYIVLFLRELKDQKFYIILLLSIVYLIFLFRKDVSSAIKEKGLHVTDNYIRSGNMADIALTSLMNEVNGDRAYVFRFHNGVRYNDGSHKKKMSIEYEVVRVGVSSEALNLQDVPVSLFPEFISETVTKGYIHPDISDITDLKTKAILKEQGIKSLIVLPYYDTDGHLMALIGVDWVINKYPADLDITKFKNDIKKIGEIIEYEKSQEPD